MSAVKIKCPWCGGILEKGRFVGHDYGFLRDGTAMPDFPRKDTVWVGDGVVYFFNRFNHPIAYCCPECRKIVIDY